MGAFSEIAIEIYEEVERLINDIGHTYFNACVIVGYERNLDVAMVIELTEDLQEG